VRARASACRQLWDLQGLRRAHPRGKARGDSRDAALRRVSVPRGGSARRTHPFALALVADPTSRCRKSRRALVRARRLRCASWAMRIRIRCVFSRTERHRASIARGMMLAFSAFANTPGTVRLGLHTEERMLAASGRRGWSAPRAEVRAL